MEIPKEFIALAKEMNKQNNGATECPLFVVQEEVEQLCHEDNAEYYKMPYYWHENPGQFDFCDDCKKYWETAEEAGECLDEEKICEDCKQSFGLPMAKEWKFDLKPGAFLTAKACDRHIKENHYHYTNPRSYCIPCWRNDEMHKVLAFLSSFDEENRNTNSYPNS